MDNANNSTISRALRHLESSNFNLAITELLQSEVDDDRNADGAALFQRAWDIECDPEGDRYRAVGFYLRSFAAGGPLPQRLNALFRSAWSLLQDKQWNPCVTILRKAIDEADLAGFRDDLYFQIVFWYAVGLEHQGRYLRAIPYYAAVQQLSPLLAPESLYREIACHNSVGQYEQALAVCRKYPLSPPPGFSSDRHKVLHELIKKEESFLASCLFETTR